MASGAGKYVVMWRRTVYICQLYDIRTYELALHRRKGAPMSVRDPSLPRKPYYIWVCRDGFFLCFFLLFLYLYKYQFWGFFKIKTYTWLKRKQSFKMSDSKVQLFNFWNLCHICAENRSVSHPNPLCCSCESLFCQTNLLPRNHNFFCFKSEDVLLDSSHLQLPLCFHGYYFCSPAHGGEAFMCGVLTDAV